MNTVVLADNMAKWMAEYAMNNKISSFVVGVSGGVDSAVACRLSEMAIQYMKGDSFSEVIAVAMPMSTGKDSAKESLNRAMELCVGRRNIDFHIVPIGRIHAAYLEEGVANVIEYLPHSKILSGNLRSRIRANILSDFAGMRNGIVVGTGNEDEDEIGYFTKWGDGAVDICPMSKIHKSKVYLLAKLLDVPSSIIEAAPTAGLWENQSDESELGMNYDEVEWAIEHDKNATYQDPNPTSRKGFVLKKVRDMRKKNNHKLHYPPIFDPSVNN